MPDLFGRTDQVYGGGLSSDAAWMWFDDLPGNGLGLLVTQMQMSYRQPVRRIFELGPYVNIVSPSVGFGGPTTNPSLGAQPVYYIVSRPEGQFSMSRIVGPRGLLSGFYCKYGNVCCPYNYLWFRSLLGCVQSGQLQGGTVLGSGVAAAWRMSGAVLTDVNMGANSQELIVSEQVGGMFVGLNLYILNGSAWTQISCTTNCSPASGSAPPAAQPGPTVPQMTTV